MKRLSLVCVIALSATTVFGLAVTSFAALTAGARPAKHRRNEHLCRSPTSAVDGNVDVNSINGAAKGLRIRETRVALFDEITVQCARPPVVADPVGIAFPLRGERVAVVHPLRPSARLHPSV